MVETSKIIVMINIITITIILKRGKIKQNKRQKTKLQSSFIPWIKGLLKTQERLPWEGN